VGIGRTVLDAAGSKGCFGAVEYENGSKVSAF
jgi:hypothetical protein